MSMNYVSHVQDVYFLVKVQVLMGSITLRWQSDVGAFTFDIWYIFKAHNYWILSDYRILLERSNIISLPDIFKFDIWYIFKAHAGDVECLGKYLGDQKLISTNKHAFKIISKKFPGKFQEIPGRGNSTFVGGMGRGNPLEIIPSHLVRWRLGDDRLSIVDQSWKF